MDEEFLKSACSKKLSEAEERLNYLELYYPDGSLREELSSAYDYYNSKDYALCIFTASKLKADSDIILSAIFVPENNTGKLLEEKLVAARRVIEKQQRSNVFPILGYSYYEYANTLKGSEEYSALMYAEYSLELSNLDMYFKKKETLNLHTGTVNIINGVNFYSFILGVSIGILLMILLIWMIVKIGKKDSSRKNKSTTSKKRNIK